ncbi:MAG: CinA family nicotinamide mononucleotide deamidase-related protein [Chloroflexi bacterium]|nr:CinA family nicotinamide mononucleotide deamidase-related protein [Chloroflexota bacterium]
MYGELISVGHELLMGEIVDTNSSYLAQRLVEAGVTPRWASQVGDDLSHIVETFQRALSRSDVVISTGGLGPTSDDLTREAVAKVMGEEMRIDPGLLAWLEGVFRQRGIAMPKTNLKQATLIPSAASVPNPTGTAPGWWVERDGRHIVILPGPPRELQLMWEGHVGPRLAKIAGAGVVVTRTIKTFGITEGGIDEQLTDLFGRPNPYLGIYARPDGIHLRLIARGPSREAAEALNRPVESEIRTRLGDAVWGLDSDTAASRAASALLEKSVTLAVVEGATAGQIGASLTAVRRTGFFLGAVVIGNGGHAAGPGGDLPGGSTEQDALTLATAARKVFGSDIGLGVTPIAGADVPQELRGRFHIGINSAAGSRVASGRSMASLEVTMQRGANQALIELISFLK